MMANIILPTNNGSYLFLITTNLNLHLVSISLGGWTGLDPLSN